MFRVHCNWRDKKNRKKNQENRNKQLNLATKDIVPSVCVSSIITRVSNPFNYSSVDFFLLVLTLFHEISTYKPFLISPWLFDVCIYVVYTYTYVSVCVCVCDQGILICWPISSICCHQVVDSLVEHEKAFLCYFICRYFFNVLNWMR